MKRILCLLISLFLLTSLFGCSISEQSFASSGTKIAGFNKKDRLPLRAIKTEDAWYLMLGNFSKPGGALAIGEAADQTETVYELPEESMLGAFAAEGDLAVWSEIAETEVRFMAYSRTSNRTTEIAIVKDAPINTICLYQGKAYYLVPTADANVTELICYDLASASKETLFAWDEGSVQAMNLSGGHLILALHSHTALMQVADFDLSTTSQPNMISLPQGISLIHGIDRDPESGTYALYYTDASDGTKVIGVWYLGTETVRSLFRLTDNIYAGSDTIVMRAGCVYWVTASKISGIQNEHYRVIAMNSSTLQPTEYMRAFSFSFDQDTLIYLRFDSNNRTDRISLFQK